MSAIQIVHEVDEWMYDLEQLNKRRNLTKHEYKIYNKLLYIRDKYYEIHKKQIEDLNKKSIAIGYCIRPKECKKRFINENFLREC